MTSHPVIQYDYDFSPYGQKTRFALTAEGVNFQRVDVSAILPRPALEKLGIAYRRIPVTAIGKDVYADSSLIIDVLQKTYGKIPTHPADKAFEAFGNSIFESALNAIPIAALTPEFKKDRLTIFPRLARPDFASLRPSGLADVQAQFRIVESEFLAASNGPFIGGDKLSLADVHIGWIVNCLINGMGLGQEKGLRPDDFPRIYKYIESLPKWTYSDVDADAAFDIITKAEFSAADIGVSADDPTGLAAGADVKVEQTDTDADAHVQKGKLVGLDAQQIVLELPTGIRLHFPRRGYILREA